MNYLHLIYLILPPAFVFLFGVLAKIFWDRRNVRKYCLEKLITVNSNGEFGYQSIKIIIRDAKEFERYMRRDFPKEIEIKESEKIE